MAGRFIVDTGVASQEIRAISLWSVILSKYRERS
jgi:hypothetical protein